MIYREIGSEFQSCFIGRGQGIFFPDRMKDSVFTFSGRTAIETVLKNETIIKKAFLPSYCCDSMIEPFRASNIEVDFYSVYYDNELKINLNIPDDVDCLLWCNYFGFDVEMPDLSEFTGRGGIVIEDITHSLFSKKQYHNQSHYLIASIRKWGPFLSGGYCASIDTLQYKPIGVPDENFLKQKKSAMDEKAAFLNGNCKRSKSHFLKKFASSNEWIAENYSELSIDEASLDIIRYIDQRKVTEIRRRNADILYSGLINNGYIKFLFDKEKMECPLFVPIIIENQRRDAVRKRLIENAVFCPVHWPKPKANCDSNLYSMELSLICDQRYEEEDMHRIVNILCQ